MGTNFYRAGMPKDERHMSTEWHIGKRSAAGMYCWDCNKTLCYAGDEYIHHSKDLMGQKPKWSETCLFCGKAEVRREDLSESSAGRELGFNKEKPKAKTGVASCCSFSWATIPAEFYKVLLDAKPLKEVVVDEYDRGYTAKEFLDVLSECPVQFTHFIGKEFC